MPWMNFDLQDGKPPIGFNLKPDDCERFMEFLAECQALKESTARFRDQRCLPEGLRYSLPALVMNGHQLKQAMEFVQAAQLQVHLTPAVVPGEHKKALLLCMNCHRRFHTERVSGHDSASTQ